MNDWHKVFVSYYHREDQGYRERFVGWQHRDTLMPKEVQRQYHSFYSRF